MKRLERLDDYVTGAMPDDEADAFEAEVFEAAARGDDADERWFDRLHALIHYIAPGDVLIRPATAGDVDALRRSGAKVHVVDFGTGGNADYTIPPNADIVVSHLRCDVREWDEVEATIERPGGEILHTFRGVQGDPATGNLYAICAAPLSQMAFGAPRVTRITGIKRGAPRAEREVIALFEVVPVHVSEPL